MKKFYFMLVALFVGFAANADYYLIGGFNGWTCGDEACHFTDGGNGVHTLHYKGQLTSGFKVNDGSWSNEEANFGSNGTKLEVGEPYYFSIGGSTGNIAMNPAAIDNPTITLDINEGTITVTGAAGDVETTYDIWGCLTTADVWEQYVLTETKTHVWEGNVTVANADGAQFGIREMTNGAQTDWYAATVDVTVAGATTIDVANQETINISINPGSYHFALDMNTCVLTVSNGAGVEAVVADNVAPVYYNLQGVRVAEPTTGLYIVVRGDKVAKQVIR